MSNVTAEHKLLAICTFNSDLIREATAITSGEHFHRQNLRAAWDILVDAKDSGHPVGPTDFHETMVQAGIRGIEASDLYLWRDAIWNEGRVTVERLAYSIQENWKQTTKMEIMERFGGDTSPESIPEMIQALQALSSSTAGNFLHHKTLREILSGDDDYDWVVEGLMERGDRLMLTGGEGAGKSTFVRQMALCLAAGVHPFNYKDIPPVKVLVIDAENSERQWRRATKWLASAIMNGRPQLDPRDVVDIICTVDLGTSLDITREAHLAAIHRKIDEIQPDIVFIGPLYKITSRAIQTDDEAAPVLRALDSIRARGCALVIEAHAGHTTDSAGSRNLRPRGSSAILGWPEFGIGLALDQEKSVPTDDGIGFETRVVHTSRWRGDRDQREWPAELTSAGPFAWNCETGVVHADRQRFYSRSY